MQTISNKIKHTLKEMVGIYPVIEYLGIPVYKNCIICPNPDHDDHHYGSCVINKKTNRVHCYACGADYDSIELLRNAGKTYKESIQILARIAGYSPECIFEEIKEDVFFPSKRERELVGLVGNKITARVPILTGLDDVIPFEDYFEETCYDKDGNWIEPEHPHYITYRTETISFWEFDTEFQKEIFKNLAIDKYLKVLYMLKCLLVVYARTPEIDQETFNEFFDTVCDMGMEIFDICKKYMSEDELNHRIDEANSIPVDNRYEAKKRDKMTQLLRSLLLHINTLKQQDKQKEGGAADTTYPLPQAL